VGLQLRPTELAVFGNPKVGTALMLCSQRTAIDLSQKALIWEDQEGTVWFSYNDPNYLVERHGITGCAEVLKNRKSTEQFCQSGYDAVIDRHLPLQM
jgi:uncharacterized protein (DUF302 family)